MQDINGREYARLSDLKVGDRLEADAGFTCLNEGEQHFVVSNAGRLCIACAGYLAKVEEPRLLTQRRELHDLEGQLADDNDSLIGLYKVA